MSSAESNTRARVKTIFATTFTAEGFTAADDKLVRAAGKDGTAAAVSPVRSREDPRTVQCLIVEVLLQLYLAYDAEPDENIVVDPTVIEGYAARLRTAFQNQSSGNIGDLWYLRLTSIDFPDDPTGNKTRLEATFEARANNDAGRP